MKYVSKKTKIALLMLPMLGVMSNTAIITSIPQFKDIFLDVENIDLLAKLMITFPSLVIAISSPFFGHIVHKTSVIKSAALALILFAIVGSAGLFLDGIYLLLGSRLLLGVGIALIMIVSTTLVGAYFKHEKRYKFMGLQSVFISIGGILFISGGGILSDIDWRYPFGLYIVGLFMLPFVIKNIEEPKNIKESAHEIDIPGNLLFVYFLGFILMVIFYTLPTQIPFLIMNQLNASGTFTGLIISEAMLFNASGGLSFAIFKKYFSYGNINIIGFFILSLGFIAIGNISNLSLFFFAAPIVGFGGGLLMTATTSWVLDLARQSERTQASGYLTSAIFSGQFVSPILFQPIIELIGLQHFFLALGICLAVSALIAKIIKRSFNIL
ncbi:MAG: MFS transporter [Campylobacterales bacterium]|nr:MFS transporter [Campylobacterales bacterium]